MKIVADNKIPFLKGVLEPYAEVVYLPGAEIDRKDVKNADALIVRTRTKCNKDLLEGSKVKFIATATIGFDHIDTVYTKNNNIRWQNAPGCNSGSVMQYMTTALLYIAKKHQFNLADKTIGIIGVGNVGTKVARIADILGMKVLLNDPPRARKEADQSFAELPEIKEKADIVTLHVPLNMKGEDKTYHLVDKEFLSEIKGDAFLINTSRGEVVDNQALKEHLQNKKSGGAMLDVWEHEPAIDEELLDLCDIGTPHIAGYSADGKANGTAMSVQAVSRFYNLGLEDWYPAKVPPPPDPVIDLDQMSGFGQELVTHVVNRTYELAYDDQNLRKYTEAFEQQRGDYPLRREFHAYQIRGEATEKLITDKLLKLGFQRY